MVWQNCRPDNTADPSLSCSRSLAGSLNTMGQKSPFLLSHSTSKRKHMSAVQQHFGICHFTYICIDISPSLLQGSLFYPKAEQDYKRWKLPQQKFILLGWPVAFLISRVQAFCSFFFFRIEIGKLYFSSMKTYICTLDRLPQQNAIQIKFTFYAHKQNIHQPSCKPHVQIQWIYIHFHITIVYSLSSFLLKILKYFIVTWSRSTPVR